MSDKPNDAGTSEPLTFEQALERLEQIVHELEDGRLGLNQSLERYEEGVKLLRQSYELLERAERKIELLSGVDSNGNPIVEPFEHAATFERPSPGKKKTRKNANQAENQSESEGEQGE